MAYKIDRSTLPGDGLYQVFRDGASHWVEPADLRVGDLGVSSPDSDGELPLKDYLERGGICMLRPITEIV